MGGKWIGREGSKRNVIISTLCFAVAFTGAFFIGRHLLSGGNALDLNTDDQATGGYDISVNVGEHIVVEPEPVFISLALFNLDSDQTLNIPLIAMPGGAVSNRNMQVSTSTTNRYGYTLMIEGTEDLTGLNDSNNIISATTGTIAAPELLAADTWGFAINRRTGGYIGNGFNLSYTQETSRPIGHSVTKWAAIPDTATPIRRVQRSIQDDVLTVYFGVAVDVNTPLDTYEGTVIYTAVPNDPSDIPRTLIGVTDMDPIMIPVTYDGSGNALKADYMKDDWYNYGAWDNAEPFGTGPVADKMWANAVTVASNYWEDVQDNVLVGEIIPNSAIIGQWVYIPRYRYDVMRQSPLNAAVSARNFTIRWQKKEDPKYTPSEYVSGALDGQPYQSIVTNQDERWYTHPAFTLGDCEEGPNNAPELCLMDDNEEYHIELDGIWMAKTEMTGSLANPTVKNNAGIIGNQSINTFWGATRNALKTQHGFAGSSDVRGARNADWGAVAYLSRSSYGLGARITPGNCGTSPVTSPIATVAESSTGNMYGVYGLSGRCYDWVMGNYGSGGTVNTSGFTSFPATNPGLRYLDLGYDTLANCTFAICGGHALFETSGWDGGYAGYGATFVTSSTAWFNRGGSSSHPTIPYYGAFAYDARNGGAGGDGNYQNAWRVIQSRF